MTITIKQQIAALVRELAMRQKVYPSRIIANKMTKEEAVFQIACIEAAIRSLKDKEYTGAIPPQQVIQGSIF